MINRGVYEFEDDGGGFARIKGSGTFRNPLPDPGAFVPKVRALPNVLSEILTSYDSVAVTEVHENAALNLMGNVAQVVGNVLTAGVWEVRSLGLLRMPGRMIEVIGGQATVILGPDSVFEPLGALRRIEPGGGLILNGQLQPPGNFQNNGRLFIGSSGGVVVPAGSALGNGGMLGGPTAGGVPLANASAASRQAAVSMGIQVTADRVDNTGSVLPGGDEEAGILRIAGTYAQEAGGSLGIEIAGPMLGTEYDQLEVSGAVELGGNLNVTLLQGAADVIDGADTFTVFVGGSIAGAFANVGNGQTLATTDGQGSFLVSYGAGSPFNTNEVVLSQFVPEPGGVLGLVVGISWLLRRGSRSPRVKTRSPS